MSLIFSFSHPIFHSFFLSFRFETDFFSKRSKKTDPSNQFNLRNYSKYFYSYIDVTMPIVEFYLSGKVLTRKYSFTNKWAWTIPCSIHPISAVKQHQACLVLAWVTG